MAFSLDPDVRQALGSLTDTIRSIPPPSADNLDTRRMMIERVLDAAAGALSPLTEVNVEKYTATAIDGRPLPLFLYRHAGTDPPGSASLFLHGGGMIAGWHRAYDLVARKFVANSGVPLLSVHYRVAPEHPYLIPVQDCYTALLWLAEHAARVHVDPARIGVMGGSAGGGLAAGVALLARDLGGPALAQQLLFSPMLDDRTTVIDPHLRPFLTWTYDDNIAGWGALLGTRADDRDISPYVAPARAGDLSDLPPTYIDVGELDIFRDEDLAYARRLTADGVPTELHLYSGVPHAFEIFAPEAEVTARVFADRIRRLKSL